jgi:competence protein ComEC
LTADVLQLGHHGSRTSSTAALLAAVRPAVALAPTGTRPRFPYPNADVVRRVMAGHAVLVHQKGEACVVSWDGSGWLEINTRVPVRVPVRGRVGR